MNQHTHPTEDFILGTMHGPDHQFVSDHVRRRFGPELHPDILNHSERVLAIAASEARFNSDTIEAIDLTIAALFHDTGAAPSDSSDRFEVVGANYAAEFAADIGLTTTRQQAIWHAVTLHTSPGIAEHSLPLVRLLRLGVVGDFGNLAIRHRHRELIDRIESEYPRGTIETSLADAVVTAALCCPAKAPPASWPGDLIRGHNEAPEERPNRYF